MQIDVAILDCLPLTGSCNVMRIHISCTYKFRNNDKSKHLFNYSLHAKECFKLQRKKRKRKQFLIFYTTFVGCRESESSKNESESRK